MAPNRKSLIAYEHSLGELENLQGKLQPNFLPLTHPDERLLSSEQVHLGVSSTQQVDSLSYWEWPSVGMKSSTHVLSSDNIVANLIRASLNKNALSEPRTPSLLVADHDEYWAEGNESFDFDDAL